MTASHNVISMCESGMQSTANTFGETTIILLNRVAKALKYSLHWETQQLDLTLSVLYDKWVSTTDAIE